MLEENICIFDSKKIHTLEQITCHTEESSKNIFASVHNCINDETENYFIKHKTRFVSNRTTLFKDIIDEWLIANSLSNKSSTFLKYSNIINAHIVPMLGNIPINELDARTINLYVKHKIEKGKLDGTGGLSPSYVNTMIIIINSVINFAAHQHLCNKLEYKISKPKNRAVSPNILSNSDYATMSICLFDNTDDTKFAIMLSLFTGLRIGEVCALKWENIDFENLTLHVESTITRVKDNQGKTKYIVDTPKTETSDRIIPIPKMLVKTMKEFRNKDNNFVISGSDKFTNPRTLEYRFHKTLKQMEIEDCNFHTLRHTFASKCIAVGMDVKSLSEILGHANAATTLKIYVHSSMDLKRLNMEKLIE